MADKTINVKIKEAYDTEANQKTKNPVLLKGQMAISSDKKKAKVGDGTSTQQNLSYMNAESANSASTATKATQDASGNVITSTYATKTELSGKADKNHTHDDRYYTESEINTKLNGKSNIGHTHDDRYYTESEINTKLNGDSKNPIDVGGKNLNDIKDYGFYYAGGGNGCANRPEGVDSFGLHVVRVAAGWIKQVLQYTNSGKEYHRSFGEGKQTSWVSVYTTDHKPTKSDVGLGNVNNTSDADKPISTATQTALNKKSDTGHTHTKAQVGLGNVDNTADANKTVAAANKIANMGQGTADVDRIVWFADSGDKAKPVWDDDFKYNPSKNILTVQNITSTLNGKANSPYSNNLITNNDEFNFVPKLTQNRDLYFNYSTQEPNTYKINTIHIRDGSSKHEYADVKAKTFIGALSGNASTATTLQTSRSINGTSFNGSANITTANQGTARNITITDNSGAHSGTATSVNGSQAYTLKMPATISASFVGSLDGNAKTATSATRASQDGNGANIASTYVKKTDLSSSMTVSAMGKNNFLLTADGCLYTSTKTETGFLMITIPHPYKNTGIKFKVSIYTNGDNTPTEYWISGKSSTSFNWVNCGAYSVGKYRNAFSNLPVVFSTDNVYKTLLPVKLIENSKYVVNDNGAKLIGETIGTKYGTKCFISIGRADTKQVSPTIVISDIMLNDAVSDFNSWKAGWTMTFTTTQKTGIYVTVNNPNILYDGHASLDLPLSGGTMSGQLNAQYDNNFISHGNEFNFEPKLSKDSEVYINYRTQSSNDYKVTKFHFRDGSNAHAYTDVQAKNFIGNLSGTQNDVIDDHGTENPNDTQIPVYNGNKMQHRVSQNIRMSLSGTTLTITA